MKNKLLFFLLVLGGLAYIVYHLNLIDKYKNLTFQTNNSDSLGIVKTEPAKKPGKPIVKRKRPRRSNPYYTLEKYAFNTPKSKGQTLGSLATYLSKGASNEYEKARLAYAWIAKNISYDDYGYNTGNYGDLSATGVLKSRKAVCEGFSNLYKALCDSMGLQAIKITGFSKGYSYTIGDQLTETNHAWNAVKIDGRWYLVDVTWGEGYGKTVKGRLKSVKKYDPFWFATDPYQFLFKHLPENKKDQLISKPISKEQYERLVYVDNGLFELGVPAKYILEKSLSDPNFKVPDAWMRDYNISIVNIEWHRKLASSKEYSFKIKCEEDIDIAFVNGKNWAHFKKENGYYMGFIKPTRGELKVSTKLNGFESGYWPILIYEVE